jgi:hypothetical protein
MARRCYLDVRTRPLVSTMTGILEITVEATAGDESVLLISVITLIIMTFIRTLDSGATGYAYRTFVVNKPFAGRECFKPYPGAIHG